MERNIQGRVVVTFTIEKEGSASNILVLQSPDKLLADEARRVIASSPAGAWTPGERRGEKVRVKYTPVDFRLPQTESATVQGAPDGNEPFLVTEKMPSFRSGEIKDFRNWIQMHIQYPAEAMKNNIQGRVIVSFIVEKDGSVSNILVLQSPDKLLADEARRVIASSPAGAWTPGEQRGEKVRVKYTLPVDFYLQGAGTSSPNGLKNPKAVSTESSSWATAQPQNSPLLTISDGRRPPQVQRMPPVFCPARRNPPQKHGIPGTFYYIYTTLTARNMDVKIAPDWKELLPRSSKNPISRSSRSSYGRNTPRGASSRAAATSSAPSTNARSTA